MYIVFGILILSIPFAISFICARLIYKRMMNSNNDSGAVFWSVLAFLAILAVTGFITLVIAIMFSGIEC